MKMPFKVCGIQSTEEADLAVAAGAAALGLVAEMPSGPGPISDDKIREIAGHVLKKHGYEVWRVLLTSRIDAEAIADHIAMTGVNTVQLVDVPAVGAHERLRKVFPHIRLIQVIHVEDERAIDEAVAAAHTADAILLDSGKPNARHRTLGGTGNTHDWSISRKIVATIEKPVFLAGGLKPDNAVAAIKEVSPYGLDICSGLRDTNNDYRLVPAKLNAFAKALAN